MKVLWFLPALLFSSCASTSTTKVEDLNPVTFNIAENDNVVSHDLKQVAVPILRSPALERRWGKPQLSVLADGSYRLYYSKPKDSFESLSIIGSPKSFPIATEPPSYSESYPSTPNGKTKQIQPNWQPPVTVVGQPVRFAQSSDLSGADPIRYSTETIRLTAPDGRSGSYRLIADSNLEMKDARSYLDTAAW